jgi:tetratricopeptide (TPR) repeat protein
MKHSASTQPRAVLASVGLAISLMSLGAFHGCTRKDTVVRHEGKSGKEPFTEFGASLNISVAATKLVTPESALAKLETLASEQLSTPDVTTLVASNSAQASYTAFERTIRSAQVAHPDRANVPLSVALISLKPSDFSPAKQGATTPLTLEKQLERTKLYVSGRGQLVAGQALEALPELEAVVALDETSGDADALSQSLGLLAEAQVSAGKRSSGLASYQRATELGLGDPRVHAFLGRELLRSKRYDEAIARLLRATLLATENAKPLTLAVAQTDLADALLSEGYVQASGELLMQVLTTLPDVQGASLRAEEAELYRRRADLWQRAGDLAVARGDAVAAESAFTRATQLPGGDAAELLERRTRALLAQGQSARAAINSLELLVPGGVTNPSANPRSQMVTISAGSRLLRALLTSGAGPALEQMLESLVADPRTSPLIARSLALITAQASRDVTLKSRTQANGELRAEDFARLGMVARRVLSTYVVNRPDSPQVFNALLDTYTPEEGEALTSLVIQLCETHPAYAAMFAQELTLHGVATKSVLERARSLSPGHCGAWILTSLLESILDLPASSKGSPACESGSPAQPGALVALTIASMRRGEWQGAVAASGAIPAERGFLKAISLGESGLQRSADALAALPSDVNEASDSLTFYQAAQIALMAEDAGRGEALLLAAKAADPGDERIYEQLLSLYMPKGQRADETQMAMLAKDLREHVPESAFAVLVAARDALSRQRYAAAAEILLPLFDRTPVPSSAFTLGVSIAAAGYTAEPALTARMLTIVENALVQRPQAVMLLSAQARLLSLPALADNSTDERADPESTQLRGARRAEEVLETAYRLLPIRDLARAREQIVGEALKDETRAAELRLQRLERSSRDIDLVLEYARALTVRGDLAGAALVIRDELPSAEFEAVIPLTPVQRARLRSLAMELTPANLKNVGADSVAAGPALLDAIEARIGPLPREAAVARIVLLCMTEATDAQRVLEAVKKAVAADPELKSAIISSIPQLLARRTSADSISMIGVLAQDPDIGSPALIFEWFRAVFVRGDAQAVRAFVKEINDPLTALRDIAGESEIDLTEDSSDQSRRAELAYWVGNAASSILRDDAAEAAYRLALEYQPDHPWTLNNLGYNLLEAGKSMDEATTMIERAAKALPEEPSVIDSLGWLRYRTGDFAVAAELIERAVTHEASNESAEKYLHLGDAKWRLGNNVGAIQAWERGVTEVQNRLQLIRAQRPARVPNQPSVEVSPAEKRAVAEERALVARLSAARERRPVGVTATHAERSGPGGKDTTEVAAAVR